MTLRAGSLRHRVTLQSLGTRTDDGMGGGSILPVDEATLNASIEPLSGEERLEAGQLETALTHRIRTRFIPGVKPHWRVRYIDRYAGERVFDIDSVIDPEERHRELELMCTELVSW
jgi:SPP1 family predicted phage head-tail adaptor